MGATEWNDPHGVLPESFKERFADCDSVDDALRKAENGKGTTPQRQMPRCKTCASVRLRKKSLRREMSHRREGQYKCTNCNTHHDERRAPLSECPVEEAWKWLDKQQRYREAHNDTMPINTGFNWLHSDDLEDPADRGMSPLFDDLDEEARVELAVRLYEPWTDAGPSYRDLAELFPHGRAWIGERVREWKGGEHRELVEQPTPTVDASSDATAVATDGGRRRWAAFGS